MGMNGKDIGAPIPTEMERLTHTIMTDLHGADLESALTVLCGILGHLVATLAEGQLVMVSRHALSVGENVRRAAVAKLLYDDEQRRKET